MENKEKDVILINKIFNSNKKSYANEGENIVHEIINLFKANNGKHYIYIVKDGHISKDYDDRISDILLTRSVGNKTVEIIAWAENPTQIIKNWESKNRKDIYETQMKKYIDKMRYDIKYNVAVDEIFENNFFKKKKESKNDVIYATFEADTLVKPKVPIFLTYDKQNEKKHPNTFYIGREYFNESQKAFLDKKTKAYKKLKEKVLNKENWEKEDTFEKINIDNFKREDNFNFLKMIKLENLELAFSNMLQYYFLKNKKVFKKFAKNVLKVDIDVNDKEFEINREEKNIDILIRDNNNVIVIENKIKSGVNGIKYDDYGNVVQTQLKKYVEYIENNKKDGKRKPHFYIFAPNYKHLKSDKFEKAKKYKIITYKEIYDFYKEEKINFTDKYFDDFLKALEKHTKNIDNEIYDIMLDRLSKRIVEIKGNKE